MPESNAFEPPPYLRSAHLQTICNSQGPRRWRAQRLQGELSTETLTLDAADGTRLLADFDCAANPGRALAILLHGWEGCSRSAYIVTTAARLLGVGYDVLRVNLRDHGDSHHLNCELFNSTRSPEVASALERWVTDRQYPRVFLAGFSLGASFALRIAADRGRQIGLAATIGICPPVDPANAMRALNEGFFAYERYFFKRWRDSLRRKLELFPDYDYADALAAARSLDDLNEYFIPRYTEYATVDDYFAAYALVGDRLAGLEVPAYLIAACDDPILPVGDLERIDSNDRLIIETHRYGGHCGFLEDLAANSWIEERLIELLDERA